MARAIWDLVTQFYPAKSEQRYRCPKCKQTFTNTLDKIYYRRQVSEEKVRSRSIADSIAPEDNALVDFASQL